MNEKITISLAEYEKLIHRSEELDALEVGGVDNWEWYEESLSKLHTRRDLDETIEELANEMFIDLSSSLDDPAGIGEVCVMGDRNAHSAVRTFLDAVDAARKEVGL